MEIPVVPVGDLFVGDAAARRTVADRIGAAARRNGFFYVVEHGVSEELQHRLKTLSRDFFAQDHEAKMAIRMELGGPAWRGYFPVGAELTSGRPDVKEGIYFGTELPADHPRVMAATPLHGANLMPTHPAELGPTVLEYLEAMTRLGHALMRGIALNLDLDEDWFAEHYTADPTILFRIFNYPPEPNTGESNPGGSHPDEHWGVGEHTDYGLLTILKQDHHGGLQVRSRGAPGEVAAPGGDWIEAPPIPGSFVCNIGDMLDRLTGGHYRSTPHRVIASVSAHRMSWPFFFDPAWDADVRPVGAGALGDGSAPDADGSRWDGADPHQFDGTYGEYLLGKVGKVFPELQREVL